MPEESAAPTAIALTQSAISLLNNRDLDGVMALLSPTCVCDVPGLGVYTGVEAIHEFAVDWFGTLHEFAVAIDTIDDVGNGVVYSEQVTHRSRTPRSFIELPSSAVVVWDRGLLTRVTIYYDPDEARDAAERLATERG